MSVALLREMFDQMVIAKNAELVERYYHPDFVMHSDGLTQDFTEFHGSRPRPKLPAACGSPRRAPMRNRPESRSC